MLPPPAFALALASTWNILPTDTIKAHFFASSERLECHLRVSFRDHCAYPHHLASLYQMPPSRTEHFLLLITFVIVICCLSLTRNASPLREHISSVCLLLDLRPLAAGTWETERSQSVKRMRMDILHEPGPGDAPYPQLLDPKVWERKRGSQADKTCAKRRTTTGLLTAQSLAHCGKVWLRCQTKAEGEQGKVD